MKLSVTPAETERFANLRLKNLGRKVLKPLRNLAIIGATVVGVHDLGNAYYNAEEHRVNPWFRVADERPIWTVEYVAEPVAEFVESVPERVASFRESYNAMQELKARGINVERRDAVETLNEIRFNEAVEGFNKDPEKYIHNLEVDVSTLSDAQKAFIYIVNTTLEYCDDANQSMGKVCQSIDEISQLILQLPNLSKDQQAFLKSLATSFTNIQK